MTKPIKLTRQAIKEGLKQTPIEHILVGAHNAGKVNLTKKQKDFARKVAEGKPKAQAYREAYDSKGKPTTEAVEGSKLASNPKIAQMIESFQLANEAREYLIPAQIRAMAIQNLVTIAIDGEEKTSNKLKALELIGKMSEVSLFSETKTHVHLHSSADIKTQLLEGLRQAFTNSRGLDDLAKRKAESLLIELNDARDHDAYDEASALESEAGNPSDFENPATPPTPDPQISTNAGSDCMHSIPHTQTPPNVTPPADEVTIPLESDTCASIGNYPNESEGGGVIISGQPAEEVPRETPPHQNPTEKG
jgi:phage terminase small subunit